ncbi:MAG: ABC transporter substrate binding protein [Thermodesulfobacteriota bacterium]|nr:ABC transporter substrate binding protein [Thermodesulfobacteriota bacterium]
MELWVGAVNLGLLYAFMSMGVFITFRIHDFPDITVDGSFTTGAAVSAVLMAAGVDPFSALVVSFFAGAFAGSLTAMIHTRFNINGLLAGILVMTGLYSVNLHIMGRSNIPLLNLPSVITYMQAINPGLPDEIWLCLGCLAVGVIFWVAASFFLKTDLGITMRATGNNPVMAGALSVNVNLIRVMGVSLANGLVGISGSLVAQYQGFADIGMGIGSIVFGLAAVIIGESVLRMRSVFARVLSVILGSVIFRFMVAMALYVGLNPIDLKLITAAFVLLILIAPKVFAGRGPSRRRVFDWFSGLKGWKRPIFVISGAVLVIIFSVFGYRYFKSDDPVTSKTASVGIVQISDHPLLNITRDSFVSEMERLGYREGENCIIHRQDANGELPTVNTIMDKFLLDDVDIVLPISTPCTQAAINKVKDRPVVFATVANPFIIGAGNSDTDHLPNVTGVYGWAPMDKMLAIATRILGEKLKVGAIWNPAHANSVFNVSNLKEAISNHNDISFSGTTITGSSEVYQAAVSLVEKKIDAFVLSPDNTVYSAFESVVKSARSKKIPIFLSDVERLQDGALGAYGYDYSISGIQAARLVDRVLKGESPGDIPFERYRKVTFGLNLDIAREIGIDIPPDLLKEATFVHVDGTGRSNETTGDRMMVKDSVPKRLALFLFSDTYILELTAEGVIDELRRSGALMKHNMTIDKKNAQNDFGMAQAIVQDIVRQRYDFIVTISTPALQAAANGNKKIPHVFGAVTDPFRMGVANTANDTFSAPQTEHV